MTRTPDDVRSAIDATLSGAARDPMLLQRVMNASTSAALPARKKLTLALALGLLLALLTGTAFAAAWRGVTWFLTRQSCETQIPDVALLMNTLQQYHTSQRLNAQIVDAYWDGATLSVACRVSAAAPALTVVLPCDAPAHDHYRPTADADILLALPESITITSGQEVSRPLGYRTSWVYEEDGALTLMHSFTLNSMDEAISLSIPITNTRISDGTVESALLTGVLPAMTDPVSAHVHDWASATCITPMTCRICGRTEGGLGEHAFTPAACNIIRTCPICTTSYKTGHLSDHANPSSCYCGEIHP